MTSDEQAASTTEERPTIHSVFTTPQSRDYCAAAIRAEFRMVEEGFEANLLQGFLNTFPELLPAVSGGEWTEHLKYLGQALQFHDWRVEAQNEMMVTGRSQIVRFLQTVPLLSEEEVRARVRAEQEIDWTALMRVTCAGTTLYFADQFSEDGGVHPECIEVNRILRASSESSDWDIALWWISANGWLDGYCPRDIYKEDPTTLYDAAMQEAADDFG